MAGELVPLVLLPRYTTYAGADDYTTIGMDVTAFHKAIVNVWRGVDVASAGSVTFGANFEESTDQDNWTACSVTPASSTVTASSEVQFTVTITKRWFRIKVSVAGTDPVVTCWAVGFLEARET